MQEFDKQFNKPVDNVILDRPTGSSTLDRKEDLDKREKGSKFTKSQKAFTSGVIALVVASGAYLGLNANNGEAPLKAPTETSEPVEPTPDSSPDNPIETVPAQPTTPDQGELLVPLTELADMTKEQLTELVSVPVESIQNEDGTKDWTLYGEKLVENLEIYVNSGSSQAEVESIYQNSSDSGAALDELRLAYEQPFEEGMIRLSDPSDFDIFRNIHLNQQSTSYIGNLNGAGVTRVTLEYVSSEVVAENDNFAVLDLSFSIKNNFFSSGALNPDSEQDVRNAGTNTDRNEILNDLYTLSIIDGMIYPTAIDRK